jgi:hypothetical protein
LVQPEMESWRSPLASIPPFSAGPLGGHRPMQWRLVEQAAAETAAGFKKEKAHTPMGKSNWLRKESRMHASPGISTSGCARARPIQ